MKKIVTSVILVTVLLLTGCTIETSSHQIAKRQDEAVAQAALSDEGVPPVQFFLKRKVVQKWIKTWDSANKVSYVYVFVHGNCIGYYVVNGKPVSSRSYLTPSETHKLISGEPVLLESIAPDGTYGEDNVGWHFFTAEGVAVAIEGIGATIL